MALVPGVPVFSRHGAGLQYRPTRQDCFSNLAHCALRVRTNRTFDDYDPESNPLFKNISAAGGQAERLAQRQYQDLPCPADCRAESCACGFDL